MSAHAPLVVGVMVFDGGADPLPLTALVQIAGGAWLARTGTAPTVAHLSPAQMAAEGVTAGQTVAGVVAVADSRVRVRHAIVGIEEAE